MTKQAKEAPLGARLCDERKRRKDSREKVAKYLDANVGSVRNWELLLVEPSPEMATRIERYLLNGRAK